MTVYLCRRRREEKGRAVGDGWGERLRAQLHLQGSVSGDRLLQRGEFHRRRWLWEGVQRQDQWAGEFNDSFIFYFLRSFVLQDLVFTLCFFFNVLRMWCVDGGSEAAHPGRRAGEERVLGGGADADRAQPSASRQFGRLLRAG